MNPTSLDILEKSQLPPVQARAILQAMELELTAKQDVFATKSDILLLKSDLHSFRSEFKNELLFLRSESKSDLASLESRLRQEMADMKAELVKWVFTCVLGQTFVIAGLFAGALYFILTYVRR